MLVLVARGCGLSNMAWLWGPTCPMREWAAADRAPSMDSAQFCRAIDIPSRSWQKSASRRCLCLGRSSAGSVSISSSTLQKSLLCLTSVRPSDLKCTLAFRKDHCLWVTWTKASASSHTHFLKERTPVFSARGCIVSIKQVLSLPSTKLFHPSLS